MVRSSSGWCGCCVVCYMEGAVGDFSFGLLEICGSEGFVVASKLVLILLSLFFCDCSIYEHLVLLPFSLSRFP
jgi:hypothetical protein